MKFYSLAITMMIFCLSVDNHFLPLHKYSDEGVVYHYIKSNIDGSHMSRICWYISSDHTIESLKYQENYPGATLVIAEIDTQSQTVIHMKSGKISEEGDTLFFAQLYQLKESDLLVVNVNGMPADTVTIADFPWHSYDFDFASLWNTWKFNQNPKSDFSFHVADVIRDENSMKFGNVGRVEVKYLGEVNHNESESLLYLLDGPGLQYRGGVAWMDKAGSFLLEYRLHLPDEPGFDNGKMVLEKVENMTDSQWEDFKKSVAMH